MGERPTVEPLIVVDDLTKRFQVAAKQTGRFGGLRTLFSRDFTEVRAVDGVSFAIAPGSWSAISVPTARGRARRSRC